MQHSPEIPSPTRSTRDTLSAALSGQYVLERELGRGGMAVVYLANDMKHGRSVALKVMLAGLDDAAAAARFTREIRVAARLQHPHVLTVFDSGDADGQPWFTMPYVDGESLRDRLQRENRLPVEDAVRIAREAAAALEYAHRHGVVHRDIKPENILITADGDTLVADFGIARAMAAATTVSSSTGTAAATTQLTNAGWILGTPAYMAPEQRMGLEGTARSDVFSLAATLYEMLTGSRASESGSATPSAAAATLSDMIPRVRIARPEVSAALEAAVRHGLHPDPAQRSATMAEFARELQQGATGDGRIGSTATNSGAPKRRYVAIATAIIVIGLTASAAVLWRRRESRRTVGAPAATNPAAPVRLAVLPFENLGDSSDAYFADGVTDEVRGKLTQLPGLAVIARASSMAYRNGHKSPQQIARELGVHYLLTGTVRWDKHQGNGASSRVEVSPELVEVSDTSAPAEKWQQPFDASLTDVFKVQSDIAGKVASALDIALGAQQERALAQQPTTNLAAYDAYLRGRAVAERFDQAGFRRALIYDQKAVALDPKFALAWAHLSAMYTNLYLYGTPLSTDADAALRAANRARELAPDLPEGYSALAAYHSAVSLDNDKALSDVTEGLAVEPRNPLLLASAAIVEMQLRHWDSALQHAQAAVSLDPRSYQNIEIAGQIMAYLRRYPEAERAMDHAIAISPSNDAYLWRAMLDVARGNLDSARSTLAAAPGAADQATFVVFVGNNGFPWMLDDSQQRLLLRQPPAAVGGDRGAWGLMLGWTAWVRGDTVGARQYADSALVAVERAGNSARDPRLLTAVAEGLALLGRSDEAMRTIEQANAANASHHSAVTDDNIQYAMARIYVLAGKSEKALDVLDESLRVPGWVSPGWLRVDPSFASLRSNPRFVRMTHGAE